MSDPPRLLDLFCGAGGCSVGYARAGFEVVGVDIELQPNYPYPFWQGDALEVDLDGFDAVHASPPCQAYSRVTEAGRRDGHPDLVGLVRELLQRADLPYVIENVVGAPLNDPVRLCGSSFGLGVQRHRLFETNFPVMVPPCAHGQMPFKFDVYENGHWYRSQFAKVYGTGGGKAVEHWAEAMGIDWMSRAEMEQAIPPAYTEHIGGFLLRAIEYAKAAV